MAIVKKITTGWVTQRFDADTGKCLGQDFTISDEYHCETEDGERIDEPENLIYQPYHMTIDQPVTMTKAEALTILRKQHMIRHLEEGMRGDAEDPLCGIEELLTVNEASAVLVWQRWALKNPEQRMLIGAEKSIQLAATSPSFWEA